LGQVELAITIGLAQTKQQFFHIKKGPARLRGCGGDNRLDIQSQNGARIFKRSDMGGAVVLTDNIDVAFAPETFGANYD
jgi:hypothetical protein